MNNQALLWLIILMVIMWVKNDLEEQEKTKKKEAELKAKLAEAARERLLKRYLLSILCYRTVKPGPSNYPCQYLEWASGVKVSGLTLGNLSENFVFYGRPAGEDDQLFPVLGDSGDVDRSHNYAIELGLSDKEAITFSALAIDFNKDGQIDLIVARSNGVWMYKNLNGRNGSGDGKNESGGGSEGQFEKIQVYEQQKKCEPYALALAEFGSESGAVAHPVKVHLSRCVNPRWIKPVVMTDYQPHHKVKDIVDQETAEILEKDVLVGGGGKDSLMSTAVVDLTPGCAEPFYGETSAMFIGNSSSDTNEFGVDPTKLDFNIQEYENFFDLYKDQILARTDRVVKYFLLREDGQTFIPDFKDHVVSHIDADPAREKKIYGGENDLFWVELIKNYYSKTERSRLRVGLPNESEMNGAEVFYGSQNHRLSDPLETVEFESEENSNGENVGGVRDGKVLAVVTRFGQKYQLVNPKMDCQYQLCSRWNGIDLSKKMT